MAQRMALYLQSDRARVLMIGAFNKSLIELALKTIEWGVWPAEVGEPAAVLQIVLHGIVIDGVQRATVLQRGLLDAVDVDTDEQAHLGFHVCRK